MDRVLCPHEEACLDDVIIHSDTWPQHLYRVALVLKLLREARLTANSKKCVIAWWEVCSYLGYHLGGERVHPQLNKTDTVAACPRPKTKKQVMPFLGWLVITGGLSSPSQN